MITVAVYINGNLLYSRSAKNVSVVPDKKEECTYRMDTGEIIKHDPKKGAAALAVDMLKTIKGI